MALVPLEEAQAAILAACPVLDIRRVPLREAAGLVVAEAVTAQEDVPPFANTAMDGYAVRAADTTGAGRGRRPVRLDVVATLAAGAAPSTPVGSGQAVRIMTGAPLPPGADAVVMVEQTASADEGSVVEILVEARPGDHVRTAGSDVAAGATVFEPGAVLTPGHLGVLASLGRTEVDAVRRARVGVLSTGDELVEGPVPLAPGQIRDSNRPLVLALVAGARLEPVDLGIVADQPEALAAAVEAGVAACDALVTTGGVSAGDFDHMKAVLDRLGEMHWWQVAIKPAKPLAFGTVGGVPVFGLPGNPVSALVSFELFAAPALRQMSGHKALHRARTVAVADDDFGRRADGKVHFVRVVLSVDAEGVVHARSAGGQGSHMLAALARADGLAVLPDGTGVPAGQQVRVIALDSLWQ